MLYRIKWAKKETLDRLPVFVYIEDGSIYDNMFSEYIRNVAANAVDANVVQLINYQNNACSDFSNLPACYKSFLEDCNDASIEYFSDAYSADVLKYVEENNIYISQQVF